jgi:hypothetical protein
MKITMKPGEAGRTAPPQDGTPTSDLPVLSFADTRAWSGWLASHHASSRGVWLKIGKKGSKAQSVTWGELALGALQSLDELLPEFEGRAEVVAEASKDAQAREVPIGGAVPSGIDWPSNSSDCWTLLTRWKERTNGADGDLVLRGLDLSQGPLRATFVTVSLANGKTEQWVTDRTGHKSSQMVGAYRRQSRTWGELALGALGPLGELLPEPRGAPTTEASTQSEAPDATIAPAVPLAIDWPSKSSDCRTRTCDPAVNSRLLYQLS